MPAAAWPEPRIAAEQARLRAAFAAEVRRHTACGDATWTVPAQAAVAASGMTIDRPQLLVVVEGCVRVPAAMNRFLDRHGLLDASYERAARDDARIRAVLLADREPTALAGDALVVIDSSPR